MNKMEDAKTNDRGKQSHSNSHQQRRTTVKSDTKKEAIHADKKTGRNRNSKDRKNNSSKENLTVKRLDSTFVLIDEQKYEIVKDYRDAFDADRLAERYSEILNKYDYVVADWGFEQLRLKGFYDNRNRKVPQEQRIGNLEDYLYEYCNFGCPYFVLQRLEPKLTKSKGPKSSKRRSNQKRESRNRNQKSDFENNRSKISRDKSKPGRSKSNRDFVKKEIQTTVPEQQLQKTVEAVRDDQGKRRFNIKRSDIKKPNH